MSVMSLQLVIGNSKFDANAMCSEAHSCQHASKPKAKILSLTKALRAGRAKAQVSL